MARKVLLTLVALLLLAGLLGSIGCTWTAPSTGYPYPAGGFMGPGGMMGPWQGGIGGMMGPGGPYWSGGTRISMEKAIEIVQNYLRTRNDSDLQVTEIMEFSYNFYAQFIEKSTSVGAFEALIDPYTGDLYPEMGLNMIWNTKYGTMSGMMWGFPGSSAPMTITKEQAKKYAQDFIDGYPSGGKTKDIDEFYGYYTIHIMKDNDI